MMLMNRLIIQIRIKERLEQGFKKNEYCHKEKEGIISLQDIVHMSSERGDVSQQEDNMTLRSRRDGDMRLKMESRIKMIG